MCAQSGEFGDFKESVEMAALVLAAADYSKKAHASGVTCMG